MRQRREKPAYQRLSDDLRAAIQEGRFGDGGRMPTEAQLQRDHGVGRHTIRQAFQDLEVEVLVYRVPGWGTFATSPSGRGRYLRSIGTIEALMAWSDTAIEVTSLPKTKTEPRTAARLKLPSDEVSVMVVRRFYEGVPFAVIRIYLAPEVGERPKAEGLTLRGSETVLGMLERAVLRFPVVEVSQDITAVLAPSDISEVIDCQPREPILYVERTYFDANGGPVELTVSHYNPTRTRTVLPTIPPSERGDHARD